ncbi:hypothetical protein SAMN05443245_2365 [Paraburkholderia fungorum]|uniref:Uncharacterized protein n=1 Tax=Paraburkholderia fungorum TaxID=134537 RepID=A0A1H1CXL7_9BURK|nr:hypothetical protein [Paraburkholderia fungorum]SDQ68964.1 hypothetical protein SAMN05443245_2365 [Paraburkholderia fungorum]
MSVVPKLAPVLQRKRLAFALIAASLCMSIAACGNDDKPDDAAATSSSSTDSPADNSSTQAATQDNPLAASSAPSAVTIQTPALPASGSDAALSATASTPLATPVIHTVD